MHGKSRQGILELGDRLWHFSFLFLEHSFLAPHQLVPHPSSLSSKVGPLERSPYPCHPKVPPSEYPSDLCSSQPSAHPKCLFVYFSACYLALEGEPLENRALVSLSHTYIPCLEQCF